MRTCHFYLIGSLIVVLISCNGQKDENTTVPDLVETTTSAKPQIKITGFRGIEFGKTVEYYKQRGVQFKKALGGVFHYEKVDEKKSIGPVDFRVIYYLFEDEGRFTRIEAWTPRHNKELLFDILVEKYGKDYEQVSVDEIEGKYWEWTFEDAIVTLTSFVGGKDLLFTIERNSPEYVFRKQKKQEEEREKKRKEEIKRAAQEDF
jgi:hypothetical protein